LSLLSLLPFIIGGAGCDVWVLSSFADTVGLKAALLRE
jgi:hypothetical protein